MRARISSALPRVSAQLVTKSLKLSTPAGLKLARNLFGDDAVNSMPRYERGPSRGLRRGWVHWRVALSAGWSREAGRGVKKGQKVSAWLGDFMGTVPDDATRGMWLGRHQQMCGGFHLMGEANRIEFARQEARREDEWRRDVAERAAARAGEGASA